MWVNLRKSQPEVEGPGVGSGWEVTLVLHSSQGLRGTLRTSNHTICGLAFPWHAQVSHHTTVATVSASL